MYNKLLGMNLCPGLSEEAALEIGVGSIEILGSKACDALQLCQRRAAASRVAREQAALQRALRA